MGEAYAVFFPNVINTGEQFLSSAVSNLKFCADIANVNLINEDGFIFLHCEFWKHQDNEFILIVEPTAITSSNNKKNKEGKENIIDTDVVDE